MPDTPQNAPGTPCWFELATTDQNAAKQFYGKMYGWTVDDFPMGPEETYTIFKLGGHDMGAAYTMKPEMKQAGIPPHWAVYFSTPDVDATTAKVAGLGGSVIMGPFDVMDKGRMSVCTDPGGATFCLWQPNSSSGVGGPGGNNTICWSELATRDVPQAHAFYTGLFGWETQGAENMKTYLEFSTGGRPRGGLLPMDENWAGIPSHWGIYFMVADCDAAAAQAKELGAIVRHGPFTAPGVGRMAMLADPQGAGFSLITLERPM